MTVDIERLAEAHYVVQRARAIRNRQLKIDRGQPFGATDHYIIRTPWEDLPESLKDVRRHIARELVEAYEALTPAQSDGKVAS